MITCTNCQSPKPESEFSLRKGGKHQTWCKTCIRSWGRENRHKYSDRNRDVLFDLLDKSKCADCGCTDPLVLEFDHTTDDKLLPVTTLLGQSLKRMLDEIEKCEIVCANCHTIRTHKRSDSRRWQRFGHDAL